MISLANDIPLPFENEKSINQNYQSIIKKLSCSREKLDQNIFGNIINEALNNKKVFPSLFYTDEQLNTMNNDQKKEMDPSTSLVSIYSGTEPLDYPN